MNTEVNAECRDSYDIAVMFKPTESSFLTSDYFLQLPEEGVKSIPGLQMPQHRRFCDAVRRRTKEYSKFFSLMMSNKTFRVYSLTGT